VPSIAYRVNDEFSVGADVVAMNGYLKFVSAFNNAVPGMADGQLQMRATNWGWGGNVGVLYEPPPGTRLGLTCNSEIKPNFAPPAGE
jgi:long-chain fatty acid transport protein